MTDYVVFMYLDGELDFIRFSSNEKARDWIEEQVNEGADLMNFIVVKGDNITQLSLSQSRRISVTIGY